MRTTVIILLLLFGLNFSYSQDYKYGKVSKEEIMEKKHPKDSSAPAAILYKMQRVYYNYNKENGFEVITEVEERRKIYSKEGFDYATEEILMYKSGSTEEKVTGLKG